MKRRTILHKASPPPAQRHSPCRSRISGEYDRRQRVPAQTGRHRLSIFIEFTDRAGTQPERHLSIPTGAIDYRQAVPGGTAASEHPDRLLLLPKLESASDAGCPAGQHRRGAHGQKQISQPTAPRLNSLQFSRRSQRTRRTAPRQRGRSAEPAETAIVQRENTSGVSVSFSFAFNRPSQRSGGMWDRTMTEAGSVPCAGVIAVG